MKEPERPIDPPEPGIGIDENEGEPWDDTEAQLNAMLGNLTLRIKMLELEQDKVRGALEALQNEAEA